MKSLLTFFVNSGIFAFQTVGTNPTASFLDCTVRALYTARQDRANGTDQVKLCENQS